MKKRVTLVTAFFDIGRGNLENEYLKRDNDKYFGYFDFWARIQNELIVYTQSEFVDKVIEIRKKYGREELTKVIAIDNIYDIEPDLYKKMETVSNNEQFRTFRYFSNALSNTPKYSYIMFLKYWCLNDANERGLLEEGGACWIDFGFSHAGEYYLKSEEFDFYYEPDFGDKVTIFTLKDPNTISGITSLQFFTTCVAGAIFYSPKELIGELWQLIRQTMISLLMLDCIDDDQHLTLMAYRYQPELFEYRIANWFSGFEQSCDQTFTVAEAKQGDLPIAKSKMGIKKRLRRCAARLYHCVVPNKQTPSLTIDEQYAQRCLEQAKKYANK